ncbi:Flp family type IVb pilin [Dietzia psychralcaliphila]|uniref:Pilus assembly protein n=1 Tax=Dietzia psychralcaliphila TaxID=139021 RepID=A0AAD0JW43_9ACTN|nr:Flp family type IVb pilin [Dietzia psychralcaliphila]AWH96638.1 pilus assembly protein [Dietzia psychralcaliphila]PTM89242.1 pilus assembly protein Flp/PilA [Dietzia psychralcaliphila]
MSQVATYFFTLYALAGDRFEDRKDRGATAVEYGLMVGLIAVAIIALVVVLGDQLGQIFTNLTGTMGTEVDGVTPTGQ